MKNTFASISHKIGQLNEAVGKVTGWLTVLMILLICFDVAAKWLAPKIGWHYSNTAVYEMQWHLFATIFLAGAAYTFKHDRHVRVDVFYANFSKKKQAWVNLLGILLFLLPFCFIAIETSITYVKNSYLMSEKSSDPGGLPYRFAIKGMMILGFSLLALQGMAKIIDCIVEIRNKEVEHD